MGFGARKAKESIAKKEMISKGKGASINGFLYTLLSTCLLYTSKSQMSLGIGGLGYHEQARGVFVYTAVSYTHLCNIRQGQSVRALFRQKAEYTA